MFICANKPLKFLGSLDFSEHFITNAFKKWVGQNLPFQKVVGTCPQRPQLNDTYVWTYCL